MLLKEAMQIVTARAVRKYELEHERERYRTRADHERKRCLNYHFEHRDKILERNRERNRMRQELKNTRDVVIVDVDNTLYDFANEILRAARTRGFGVLRTDFNHWGAWDLHIPEKDWNEIVDEIHGNQSMYDPYEDARDLLTYLCDKYYVIIASHRRKSMAVRLARWLKDRGLPYHEVCVFDDRSGETKDSLFNRKDICGRIKIIVDDSPKVLTAAKSAGIPAVGLREPWNDGNGFTLFSSLREIREFIDERNK